MGPVSLKTRIKEWIAEKSFKTFLWTINSTPEQYWRDIYIQEKILIEHEQTKDE